MNVTRLHRLRLPAAAILIALLVLVFALPVLAAPTVATSDAVVAQDAPSEGPAEEVPPASGEDEEDPWTTRYLIPAALVLTGVVLLIVLIAWAWRRSRYQVAR
jgi:hypothetical protein